MVAFEKKVLINSFSAKETPKTFWASIDFIVSEEVSSFEADSKFKLRYFSFLLDSNILFGISVLKKEVVLKFMDLKSLLIHFKEGIKLTYDWYNENRRYYKSISKKDILNRLGN